MDDEWKRKKRITLADVGRLVGVDASTVSLVLGHKPLAKRVKATTREKIFAAAASLGYIPSPTARALRTGDSGMVGIVVGDIASGFYSEMTAAALRAAEMHRLQLLVAATEWNAEKEYNALAVLIAQRVNGIIYLPGSLAKHQMLYARILNEHLPLVTYDCEVEGVACVKSDYLAGMQAAVRDLRSRHKKVCYIHHSNDVPSKREAFLKAAAEQGLETKELVYSGDPYRGFEFDQHCLYQEKIPCACVLGGDEQAIILMDRLLRDGRQVPEEYEIIGIDGIRLGAFFHPHFATIQQNCDQLMLAALKLLTAKPFAAETISVSTRYLPVERVTDKE